MLVANIPEGLPATIAICLSITAKRMASRSVLVKRATIIETLGSTSIIASDKTGTLTCNCMTVENLWYNRAVFNAAVGRPDVLEKLAKSSSTLGATLEAASPAETRHARLLAHANPLAAAHAPAESAPASAEQWWDAPRLSASVLETQPTASTSAPADMPAAAAAAAAASPPVALSAALSTFTVSAFHSVPPPPPAGWARFSAHAKIMTIAGVCNRARYGDTAASPTEEGPPAGGDDVVLGDASDAGLFRYCDRIYPVAVARRMFPKARARGLLAACACHPLTHLFPGHARLQVYEIPFNSFNKWNLVVVPDPDSSAGKHIVFMKGAPEIVLARCTDFMYLSGTRPIDDDFKEEYTAAYERFGCCGERVLGLAYKVIDSRTAEAYATEEGACPTTELTFCGLISLVDPPRPGVADAVAACRRAGIRVTMVTGDHPLTAEAIARKVNIITKSTPRDVACEDGVPESAVALSDERVEAIVITGQQVALLSEADWNVVLSKQEVVFARTTPQQKLQLVEQLQRRGEVVAVTGDGVNDSPALKRADVGIAMGGEHASDVAREAADIILLDDNFMSITGAIEEGRTQFGASALALAHMRCARCACMLC